MNWCIYLHPELDDISALFMWWGLLLTKGEKGTSWLTRILFVVMCNGAFIRPFISYALPIIWWNYMWLPRIPQEQDWQGACLLGRERCWKWLRNGNSAQGEFVQRFSMINAFSSSRPDSVASGSVRSSRSTTNTPTHTIHKAMMIHLVFSSATIPRQSPSSTPFRRSHTAEEELGKLTAHPPKTRADLNASQGRPNNSIFGQATELQRNRTGLSKITRRAT